MTLIFISLAMKVSECNVINSANPLYLRIVDMKGQFEKGKDDAWYLVISDDDDVYKKLIDIFDSIKKKITEKTWDVVEYDKGYMKIKFESNNILPADKDVNIHLATIVIRAIFAQDGKHYPQLFLDDGLYKNVMSMKKLIFQKESMLIWQINQKNVCFVVIGIFYIKTLAMYPIFAMGVII